jgi:hypothetical protein
MTMQREDRQEKLVRFAFREKKGKEAATGIRNCIRPLITKTDIQKEK